MAQVLVVEDDETIGRTLTSSLGVDRHTARWVMTGAAALSAAEQQPFDLALLDLGWPDMDGVDVCRAGKDYLGWVDDAIANLADAIAA